MKSLLLLFVPCMILAQPPRGQRPMGPPPPMVQRQQIPPVGMGRHHMHMRHRRPYRLEITPQQQKQLLELRREYIQKRNRILNNL